MFPEGGNVSRVLQARMITSVSSEGVSDFKEL